MFPGRGNSMGNSLEDLQVEEQAVQCDWSVGHI